MDMGMRNGWERMVCMSDESGASELQGKLDAEHTRCIKTRIERAIDCRKVLPHSISPPSPLLHLLTPLPSLTSPHLSHPVHHSSFPSRPPLIFPIPSTTHLSHPVHHSSFPSRPPLPPPINTANPRFRISTIPFISRGERSRRVRFSDWCMRPLLVYYTTAFQEGINLRGFGNRGGIRMEGML